jgi:predicted MFS family arabinose efflux permease
MMDQIETRRRSGPAAVRRHSTGALSSGRRASLGLIAGFFTLFMIGTDLFVVSPLLPMIAGRFRVPPGQAGLMVAVFSVTYVVAAPLLGSLADRRGRRRILGLGLLTFALANVMTGLAPGFVPLLAARALAGLSAAAITPSVYALVGQAATPARRGSRLAIVGAGLLIALASGSPLGAVAAERVGWRPVFIALGAIAFVLAAANLRIWRGTESSPGAAAAQVSVPVKARAVAVTACWGAAVYGFYTYLGSLRGQHGFGALTFALLLVCYGAGAVTGSIGGGRLSDVLGARRVATLSLLGLSTAELALAALLSLPALVVVVLGLLAVVGYAAFPAHQSRLVGAFQSQSGSVLAWNNSALYVGITAGSLLGGALLSLAGFAAILPATAAIGLLGAAFSMRGAIPRGEAADLAWRLDAPGSWEEGR